MFKKIVISFCGFIVCLSVFSMESPKPGDPGWFHILAWGSPAKTPEGLRMMKECGITIAGFVGSKKILKLVHDAGLVAYAQHEQGLFGLDWRTADPAIFETKVKLTADTYKSCPGVYGYVLCDEPPPAYFSRQGEMYRTIKRMAPDKDIYVNLLPTYAFATVKEYQAYLDRYVKEYNPKWIGYDFYALMEKSDRLRNDFWLNLDMVRSKALEAGIPFHICTLAVGHLDLRVPDKNDLYFEIYSGLLYGAKGIDIFKYFTPEYGNYREGPVDPFGHKTQTWYNLREVLSTVHVLAPLLNRLKSTEVYHIPVDRMEAGTRGPSRKSLIREIKTWNNDPARYAVGEFADSKGQSYIMIQNKSLEHSAGIDKIIWKQIPQKVEIVSPFHKNNLRKFAGEARWIAPGRAIFLKVTFAK